MIVAMTGATGFVGAATLDAALSAGHSIRALTRRPQRERKGVAWVPGDLADKPALAALCAGAEAIIHIAGVVNAPTRAGFLAGNVEGTRNVVDAAQAAEVGRLVHVSSLAAREPDLSTYGWSKGVAEQIVEASTLNWTMVRPPAVYGPGDMEMRDLFRLAARGFALLPPEGRLSVIEVSDLARLLIVLATTRDHAGRTFEPDDGMAGGWTHRQFARAIGTAVGRARIRTVATPRPLMHLAAGGDRLFRRDKAKLTPDRVRYFCHPDWVATKQSAPPAALWEPQVPTPDGLRRTAEWYRAQGLL